MHTSMSEANEGSEFVCGSHVFDIVGYSTIKGLGTGKYIRSSSFHVGDHDWVIQFFPNGRHSYTAGYASLYAKILNPAGKKVSAILSFSVRTRDKAYYVSDQSALNTMNSSTLLQTFDAENPIQGVPYFMKKADLSSSKYLCDDCLTFRCILWVCMDSPAPTAPKPPVAAASDLALQLGRLLESGDGADVRFSIGGKTLISAHKCVLAARSPVFRKEFGDSTRNSSVVLELELEDMHMDADTLQALLRFIYTDSLSLSLPRPDGNGDGASAGSGDKRAPTILRLQRLLTAASHYKLEGLKAMCEEKLRDNENLSLETVATTLALAEEHGCWELRAACMEYATKKENYLALPLTDGFDKLKHDHPALLKELVERAAQ